jgi:alkaline phosphatase/alkaline phosphatase D
MTHLRRSGFALIATIALAACGGAEPVEIAMTNGQGEIAGEVTATSVILQTRLTSKAGWVDGDLPGVDGIARFELATSADFADTITTDWLSAAADSDHIVKAKIDGLSPGTEYVYRVAYGPDPEHTESGATRSFATHPGADTAAPTSFTVVTGMNYYQFYDNPNRAYTGPDKELGFPGLASMLALEPDFFVATGDNVYYDAPYEGRADTAPTMRRKWHRQLSKQRFIDFFTDTPTYWEKDDHDYRYNDCDNTSDAAPLPDLGRRIFLEQVPVADPNDPDPLPYRTHRVSRDLQIWLIEGREYRSPNMMEPGPGKTLWGVEQLAWFKRTLAESDATFKILISPTPMVGPDDADQAGRQAEGHDPFKRDNQSNPMGFQYERDRFFDWLEENGFLDNHFYIVSGDRHWQYHSIHPRGFEEFSTGALVDANARLGRAPGDPGSNDPDGLIVQPFSSPEPTGGFLEVTVTPGEAPAAAFRWFDEHGFPTYETVRTAG